MALFLILAVFGELSWGVSGNLPNLPNFPGGIQDLPIGPGMIPSLLRNCDVGKLAAIIPKFTSDVNPVVTVATDPSVLSAICANPACPSAMVSALDWSKVEQGRFSNADLIQKAVGYVAAKLCVYGSSTNQLCAQGVARDLLPFVGDDGSRNNPKPSELETCTSGCFESFGGEIFLQSVSPLLEKISMADALNIDSFSQKCSAVSAGTHSSIEGGPSNAAPTLPKATAAPTRNSLDDKPNAPQTPASPTGNALNNEPAASQQEQITKKEDRRGSGMGSTEIALVALSTVLFLGTVFAIVHTKRERIRECCFATRAHLHGLSDIPTATATELTGQYQQLSEA